MTLRTVLIASALLPLAACFSEPSETAEAPAGKPAVTSMQTQVQLPPQTAAFMGSVNEAPFTPLPELARAGPAETQVVQPIPAMVKAQVLLGRARFSPGVVDGRNGENVRQAIAAFEEARGLPVDGKLDQAVWDALVSDTRPVLASYVITDADLSGPFLPTLPPKDDYEAMAALPALSYTSAAEMLAERFHMDEKLLRALNPGVDFTRAGVAVVVTDPGPKELGVEVARIEVDKTEKAVRAFDASNNLVAFYPATIGSSDMPTPKGTWKVNGVARDPTWNYDPAKLNFGKGDKKLTIPAGPNNPVGAVWIDLSKDTYGLHGTPDPEKIGKTESHGCVRMTNWDALQLAGAVKPGVTVEFVRRA